MVALKRKNGFVLSMFGMESSYMGSVDISAYFTCHGRNYSSYGNFAEGDYLNGKMEIKTDFGSDFTVNSTGPLTLKVSQLDKKTKVKYQVKLTITRKASFWRDFGEGVWGTAGSEVRDGVIVAGAAGITGSLRTEPRLAFTVGVALVVGGLENAITTSDTDMTFIHDIEWTCECKEKTPNQPGGFRSVWKTNPVTSGGNPSGDFYWYSAPEKNY